MASCVPILKGSQELLLAGLSTLLRGFRQPALANKTISSSFDLAAQGLGASRAGLFLIHRTPESTHLETFCSVGLPQDELRAVECDTEPEDMRFLELWKTLRSTGGLYGAGEQGTDPQRIPSGVDVLCLPVSDPILGVPAAVLYFEREDGIDSEFAALTREQADVYSLALGQLVHVGFRRKPLGIELDGGYFPADPAPNAPELIGDSMYTQALRRELHDIHIRAASAPDPEPILILGEKGSGKDLVARYIYAYSTRRNRPYVAVNCGEVTQEMAAARLFGHKKGSFTGSVATEPGFFRAADHGVLFLDEICDMPLSAQATLLRVLENRTIVPLGETRELRVDVQVILATNRDPEKAVAEGKMRPDLLDRFGIHQIRLAPLRERPWDIPALAQHFLAYHAKRTQKNILGANPDALRMMVGHSWSGNVRELARVCSLLVTHVRPGAPIDCALLARLVPQMAKEQGSPRAGALLTRDLPMRDAVETFSRELILARLREYNWNIKSARESLRLPKTTFHRYARSLGISAVSPEAGRAAVS